MPNLKTIAAVVAAFTLAIGSLAIISTAAFAKKSYTLQNVDVIPVVTPLSGSPAFVFTPVDGKWVLEDKGSVAFSMRIRAERREQYTRIHGYQIGLWRSSGPRPVVFSTGATVLGAEKIDKTVRGQISWKDLEVYLPDARKICETYGKPKEKVVMNLYISMFARFAIADKDYNPGGNGFELWQNNIDVQYQSYRDNKGYGLITYCNAAPFK